MTTAPRSLSLDLPLDPDGQRRVWGEAFAPFFDVVPTEADPAPGGRALARHRLGALTLIEMTAPAQILRRTPAMAVGPRLDGLMVLFWLHGEGRMTWPGGESTFGRLQGVLLDLAQPADIVAGPVRATGLFLSRTLVVDQVPNLASLHGAVLDLNVDPVCRLFFTCVQELIETVDELSDAQIPQVTQAVATLCVAALRRRTVEGASDDRRRGMAVRRFIQAELGASNLSVEAVAARFGLSRAGLYRLFSDEGGVQRFIREQRLARAMAMLARPRGAGRPRVSAVAYACGFSDEKTFSRAFKRRFGLLPSAVGPVVPARGEADPEPTRQSEEGMAA